LKQFKKQKNRSKVRMNQRNQIRSKRKKTKAHFQIFQTSQRNKRALNHLYNRALRKKKREKLEIKGIRI